MNEWRMKAPNQSIKPRSFGEINSACLPPHLPWLISFSLDREHDRSFYRANASSSGASFDRDALSVAFPRSSHGLGSCRGCQAQGKESRSVVFSRIYSACRVFLWLYPSLTPRSG